MKRVDVGIANYLIKLSAGFRCPLGLNIKEGFLILLAVDNFNHKEQTDSGGEVSNDTVGVVFQNQICLPGEEVCPTYQAQFTTKENLNSRDRKRALAATLPCQTIVVSNLGKKSAEIEEGFNPIKFHDNSNTAVCFLNEEYFLWWACRYFVLHMNNDLDESDHLLIPSCIAVKSRIIMEKSVMTQSSFMPVLPYPATSMDSIFTMMLNFQDILLQRDERSGVLWCDEGVYCLAKEIQML